jgi:hypothetical protein
MKRVQAALTAVRHQQQTNATEASSSVTQISNADLLLYISDMVEELQVMCERTGCSTLLGLLALARSEAVLQQTVASGQRRAG